MEEHKLSARDEMLHIMKIIWGSRTAEHLKSCENMIETFEKKHGSNNIGLTLMAIEMTRQKRLNKMFESMGVIQSKLKEKQGKTKKNK